jgi:hypothetical protein
MALPVSTSGRKDARWIRVLLTCGRCRHAVEIHVQLAGSIGRRLEVGEAIFWRCEACGSCCIKAADQISPATRPETVSDTPSTNVHDLAVRITKLFGVTLDQHTMWQLVDTLGRFKEAVDAGAQDARDTARMALDDAREAREAAQAALDAARRIG